MYYPDLSYYRISRVGKSHKNVYVEIRNVGWLWKGFPYSKGTVEPTLVSKLREIAFLYTKNQEDKERGLFNKADAIVIHQKNRRGRTPLCPLCNKIITLESGGLKHYTGERKRTLGKGEICLPSPKEKGKGFYSSPTLLYHYITEHSYQPPKDFLEALDALNLNTPFDVSNEKRSLACIEVPTGEVDRLHLRPIPEGLYFPCKL